MLSALAIGLLGILGATAPLAQAPDEKPGRLVLRGSTTTDGFLKLKMEVLPLQDPEASIVCVKVYAEPGARLLFAQVDPAAPSEVVDGVKAEHPKALLKAPVGDGSYEVEVPPPDVVGEPVIRVEYVMRSGRKTRGMTVAYATLKDYRSFAFTAVPSVERLKRY